MNLDSSEAPDDKQPTRSQLEHLVKETTLRRVQQIGKSIAPPA